MRIQSILLAILFLVIPFTQSSAQSVPIGVQGSVPICTHAQLTAGTCQLPQAGYTATITNANAAAPNACAPGAGTGAAQRTCRYVTGTGWEEFEPVLGGAVGADAIGINELDLIDGDVLVGGDCLTYAAAGANGSLELVPCGASGGVDTANNPLLNEYARFTDPDTIEGRTASEVRTDLGLVIGTNIQAWDADLDDLALDGILSGSRMQTFGAANAGAVPLSGGGTANYLRADGTWAAPTGSGTVTTANSPLANEFARFTGATTIEGLTAAEARSALSLVVGTNVQAWDADLDDLALDGVLSGSRVQTFGAANAGVVPLSGGGTTNFLRADGTWVAPPASSGTVDTLNSPLANEFARFTDPDTIEGRTASEARSDLGLVIGTNVQAWDADLDDLALDGVLQGSRMQTFGAANAGAVPLSGGGTTNYLRADGTWASPPGSGGFDSTAVDSTTWSDSANASNVWTFALSGATDPTMTFANNLVTFNTPISATSFIAAPAPIPTYTFRDSDATAGDVNAQIAAYCGAYDGGPGSVADGAEDCDVIFSQQEAGALRSFLTADADDEVELGNVGVNRVVITTDGSGNDELVLPPLSVGDAEIDALSGSKLTGTVTATAVATNAIDAATDISTALCSDGQILKKTGGAWACGADVDTNTNNVALSGNTVSVNPADGLASGACNDTDISAAGVVTTDVVVWSFDGPVDGVVGFDAKSTTGSANIQVYPVVDNIRVRTCNPTSGSLDPGAFTINWKVIR